MTQQYAWKKIIESGTVKLVSVKEPRKIKKQLAKKGKSKRILPGVAPTKKSRLCLLGDLDPDIMEIEKFAPAVNTMNLAVMMQFVARVGHWSGNRARSIPSNLQKELRVSIQGRLH